ncbi:hypothetical protein C8R43DRAFT_1117708 [Mycena crocata]|nr:hypothetical protein C8R43DRAFT_1136895 [Mycena crocata]KAJ7180408.1 hypothetical protein C8R43DRAFT_1117708 [Mycena crocata]
MTPHFLFYLALRSPYLFGIVMHFISEYGPQPSTLLELCRGSPGDRLSSLPYELCLEIVGHLALKDRIVLAQASRKFRALAAHILQASLTDLMADFGLAYHEVRFMQTITLTVLSGSALPLLSLYSRYDADAYTPGDLDFYSPRNTFHFAYLFFTIGTSYRRDRRPYNPYDTIPSLKNIYWLVDASRNRSINLMQAKGLNAMEPPTQFHSSAVCAVATAEGIWLSNPRDTFDRITLISRDHLYLDTLYDRERSFAVLKKWIARGFSFRASYHRKGHVCGVDKRCPATLRTTLDNGCLVARFPNLPYGVHASSPGAYPARTIVRWSFGGSGCPLKKKGVHVVDSRSDDLIAWKSILFDLIRLPAGSVVT